MSERIFFNAECWKQSLTPTGSANLWVSGECVACTNSMLVGTYSWNKIDLPHNHTTGAGQLKSGSTLQVSGFI